MLHLVLKVSTRCNANCLYCQPQCRGGDAASMPLSVVERVLARVNAHLLSHPAEEIEFLWHGGEPLMLGPDYYNHVWDLQQALCPTTGPRIRHGMQTNLTCLNEAFIPVLQRLKVREVGTSYDPEPHVRGLGPDRDSVAYAERFLRAITILERHGIGWGLIYVVARHSLADPEGIFHFLTNLGLGGSISLNPVLTPDGADDSSAVTPEEYAEFLGAVFPVWLRHRSRYPSVEPFASLVKGIETRALDPDALAFGTCDPRPNRVTIGPVGDIYPSGLIDGSPERAIGTIDTLTLEDASLSLRDQEMQRRQLAREAQTCRACRLASACSGATDASVAPDSWCRARLQFVERYLEPLTGLKVEHAGH